MKNKWPPKGGHHVITLILYNDTKETAPVMGAVVLIFTVQSAVVYSSIRSGNAFFRMIPHILSI